MSHSKSRLLAICAVLAFFLPMALRGHVIAAHDNRNEIALPADPEARLSNRKFFDQTSIYFPEIQQHLHGRSSGWISLWNPYPEMGRPTYQVSGFSKAFSLFHLLSFGIENTFVLYTLLAFLAVLLTVLFAHLLFECLGLSPPACFCASVGLGLGVFSTYWLTFSLFIWTLAWSLGLCWCVARYLERARWGYGLGTAFCLHSLFISGYPQQIVLHAYFIVGFTLHRAWLAGGAPAATLLRLARLGAFVLLGLVSILPVYADLALAAQRSARADTDPAFFLSVLPPIRDPRDLLSFLSQLFDAFWLGNPIHPRHPVPFNGVSMTPLYAVLAMASLAAWRRRGLWPLQLFVALTLLANVSPAVYRLGVQFGGLDISRFNPLAGVQIPLYLLAAYGLDEAFRRGRGLAVASLCIGLAVGGIAILGAVLGTNAIDVPYLSIGLAIFAGSLLLLCVPNAALAVILTLVAVLHYGFRLPLTRPVDAIHTDSPLVEILRAGTADGSRFAWVGRAPGPLRSNQEALLGTPSVHTYNSLSSRAYQEWVLRISDEGTYEAGRFFTHVAGTTKLLGSELSFTGIGTILCQDELEDERVVPVTRGVYRTRERPQLEFQLSEFHKTRSEGSASITALERAGPLAVVRTSNLDDQIELRVTPSPRETLLFLSQEHHPHWIASAAGERLATPLVNGFYQGALIPPNTEELVLEFRPWSRWSFLPQLFFLACALGLGIARWIGRTPRAGVAGESGSAPEAR